MSFGTAAKAGSPLVVAESAGPGISVILADAASLRMIEHSADEVLGRDGRSTQSRETDLGAVTAIPRAVRKRATTTVELLIQRRDGTPFFSASIINLMFGEQGEPLHARRPGCQRPVRASRLRTPAA